MRRRAETLDHRRHGGPLPGSGAGRSPDRRDELSAAHREDDRVGAGRRRRRHRGAHHRREAAPAPRPAVHRREPAGRGRQYRRGGGRFRRARRLHAAGGAAFAVDHQPDPLPQAQFRSRRVRAGGDHDGGAERAGGPPRLSRRLARRVHRLREGQSGQAQFRLAGGRNDPASVGRAVQPHRRHGAGARALQGHSAGGERHRGRPRRPDVPGDGLGLPAAQSRSRQGAGDLEPRTGGADGRRCDLRRGRPAGVPVRHLERHRGAAAHAAGTRGQAQRGHQPDPVRRRREGAFRDVEHAAGRRSAERSRRADPGGNAPLGRRHPGRGHFGELSNDHGRPVPPSRDARAT